MRDVAGTTVKEEVAGWRMDRVRTARHSPFHRFSQDKRALPRPSLCTMKSRDPFRAAQSSSPTRNTVIIQNRPARPLTADELDTSMSCPFPERPIPLTGNPSRPWSRSSSPSPATAGVRILLLLCPDPPSGKNRAEPESGLHPGRGGENDSHVGLQRHHPGCGRADGQHVRPRLPRWKQGACHEKLCRPSVRLSTKITPVRWSCCAGCAGRLV